MKPRSIGDIVARQISAGTGQRQIRRKIDGLILVRDGSNPEKLTPSKCRPLFIQ